MFDGTIDNAINLDNLGADASGMSIYTGTKSNGTLQDVGNCTDWTDGVGPGSTHVANNNAVDGEWMEALALTMCSNTAKVYCLSTD